MVTYRKFILAAFAFIIAPFAAQAQIDITDKFTDLNFRAKVYTKIGKSAPAPIYDTDVVNIREFGSFGVSNSNISSLNGIEYLTKLQELYASNNNLTTLDVSKNTELTHLSVYDNNLTTLDLSKNTALEILWVEDNNLTTLDVSKSMNLEELDASNNNLTTLDISKNVELYKLYASNNNLTTLDISKNTELYYLIISGNNLTTLDVSKNTELYYLVVVNNYFASKNDIIGLDESKTYILFDPQREPTPIIAANSPTGLSIVYNSAAGVLQVNGISKAQNLLLVSINGRVLLNKTVQPNESISIAHLPKGVYLVNVAGKTVKFVK